MRLGLIARADNSGLGTQTWEFYRHMKPAKTLIVDISHLNHNKQYYDRYPGARVVHGFPAASDWYRFLADLDVVFVAESSYGWGLYHIARELGVKVAVQYNYEFFDWAVGEHPLPDMFIAPSRWHYDEVDTFARERGVKHVYLHVPVDRERLPFRQINQAKIFLHPAGRSAAHDRNGTETVIQAARYVRSDAVIRIHFQGEQGLPHQATHSIEHYKQAAAGLSNVQVVEQDHDNYWEIYKDADVLLMPRRYGGNCLPVNEALSQGMPVLMSDVSPNHILLPPHWLMPATKISEFTPRTPVDIYDVDPRDLAFEIDEMVYASEGAFSIENHLADAIAKQIDWKIMRAKYEQALGGLLQ